MFKVMGIIKRPEGMEFSAFKQWWLEEHAPKVKRWPGLKEYRINLCTTPDQDYDGIAEVFFERLNIFLENGYFGNALRFHED